MGMAEEKYDEKRGLYYDHSTIYKKEPDPFDEVKQFDNIKMNHFENEDDRMATERLYGPIHRVFQGELYYDDARTTPAAKEKVNHPQHYNQGKIEVIDAIDDWDLDFCEGNIVKYVTRSRHKGNRLQDLEKAKWYLDHLVERARLADNQNLADNQPPCPDKRNA
jgi:hypothetical protein